MMLFNKHSGIYAGIYTPSIAYILDTKLGCQPQHVRPGANPWAMFLRESQSTWSTTPMLKAAKE